MLFHEHVAVNQETMARIFSFQNDHLKKIIPIHFHQSVELIYCVNGSLTVEVDQKSYLLQAGDLLAINPNTPHETKSTIRNEVFVLQIKSGFYDVGREYLDLNTVAKSNNQEFVKKIQTEIISIYFINKNQNPHYHFLIQSKLALIKYYLSVYFLKPLTRTASWHQPELVQKYAQIIDYIKIHLADELNLTQIAEEVGYSVPYLSKLFKNFTGITIMTYINQLRLEQALHLMQTTNKNLLDISFEVGFPNVKSFRKSFKNELEMTPKEYLTSISIKPKIE